MKKEDETSTSIVKIANPYGIHETVSPIVETTDQYGPAIEALYSAIVSGDASLITNEDYNPEGFIGGKKLEITFLYDRQTINAKVKRWPFRLTPSGGYGLTIEELCTLQPDIRYEIKIDGATIDREHIPSVVDQILATYDTTSSN